MRVDVVAGVVGGLLLPCSSPVALVLFESGLVDFLGFSATGSGLGRGNGWGVVSLVTGLETGCGVGFKLIFGSKLGAIGCFWGIARCC